MRGAIGLIGVLVTVGVIAVIWSVIHPTEPVRQAQRIRPQVEQMTGYGPDREAAVDSFEIDPVYDGARLRALRVTQVSAGGAMDRFYGLRTGDIIVEYGAGGNLVAVQTHDDPELVKALIHDSYRGSQPIVVTRDGRRVVLPITDDQLADDDQTPPRDTRSSLQRQLDSIQRVPTH